MTTTPPLSAEAKSIQIGGQYEHFKGLLYKIIAIALDSETLEELVVYQSLYDEGGLWVRPVSVFLEQVTVNGRLQPRFQYLEPQKK